MYDIFVISDDVAGEKMAGPGIRAWHISKYLSQHFKVVLAIPDYSYKSEKSKFFENLPFDLVFYSVDNPSLIKEIGEKSQIIIIQGYILSKFPVIKELSAHLICDLYVPFPLENLFVYKWKIPNLKDREFIHLNDLRVYNDQIIHGDHFLCACERQRDLFVGSLLSLNRINPEILDQSPSLEDLISVVYFGITENEEEDIEEHIIRNKIPQIKEDDILLFWGGVITNWYDPYTLINAFNAALTKNPKLKLFFIAKKHPNPLLPEFEMANEAVKISNNLGLTNNHIFFNEEWIEYKKKGNYFRDADIGISIHKTHFETYYSFRIRLLDYLKYHLPIICTEGDFFADLVKKENLGITVDSECQEDLTEAILVLAADREKRTRTQKKIEEIKTQFYWEKTTKPLINYCRKVLKGEIKKKKLPTSEEINFISLSKKVSVIKKTGKKYLWSLFQKLPFNLAAKIRRLFRFFC